MVFGSNLTGLYSGLQALAAPAKTTTAPFVAAAPAEGMSDTGVALVAGALSGIVADVITHPICTVKARMMVQGAQVTAGEAGAVVYDGLLSGFATISFVVALDPLLLRRDEVQVEVREALLVLSDLGFAELARFPKHVPHEATALALAARDKSLGPHATLPAKHSQLSFQLILSRVHEIAALLHSTRELPG